MSLPQLILDRPDRPYELKWCDRAEHRLGSLERPPAAGDLGHRNGQKAFYALSCFVWACLVERGHRFTDPEELVDYLGTVAQQNAALDAINAMFLEAFPLDEAEKKSAATGNETARSSEPSAPKSGPSPSSTSA